MKGEIIYYENAEASEDLRARVEVARARLAEVEAAYTIDKAKVDSLQASLFQRLRTYRQERDRLRLIVDYRRQFLAGVLRGDAAEAERVKQAQAEAEARNAREYEETAQVLAAKKELTAQDEAALGKLWKNLVKLYHPDRFSHEPDKLDTYGKLTAAINRAKDTGDLAMLKQIADDPHGFILKQGWTSLDFRDEEQAKRLEQLYVSLMAEIRNMLTLRERLHQSPEFELYQLTAKKPEMLDTVAEKQKALLESEIAELTRETERLAAEIGKLTGHPAPGADATPRASGPANDREASPPPPPQQEQPPPSPKSVPGDQARAEHHQTREDSAKSTTRFVCGPMPEPNFSEEDAERARRAENWTNVKNFVGCSVSTIYVALIGGMIGACFGQIAGLVGIAAGVVGGLMLGRSTYYPRPEKPTPPKKITETKKPKSESKVAGVIGLIVLFGLIALFAGFHIACTIALVAWAANAFVGNIASATADEIEKRKKP